MSIASGKNQGLWVAKESTFNTAATLTSAGFIPVMSDLTFDQEENFVDDNEKRMTFSRTGRSGTGFDPGTFSFEMKSRASGALGTAPVGDPIFESLYGDKTEAPSTSVTYDLAAVGDDVVSFTALRKDGHETRMYTGCVAKTGDITIKAGTGDDAIVKDSVGGIYMREYVAGTDALKSAIDGTTTPVTVIPLKTAGAYKRFSAGALVTIGTDDNSGTGHVIASVDSIGNTITLSGTGVTTSQAGDAVVKGWTPAATESGYTTLGRYGHAQMNKASGSYANVLITEAKISIDNGAHALDEKNDTLYPSAAVYGDRVVSVDISRFFTEEGTDYLYDSANQVVIGLKIPAGSVAGKRVRFEMPNVQINKPKLSGDLERMIGFTGLCLCTASLDDEIRRIYD